jgi:threonine synthase
VIRRCYESNGYLVDPHTACGLVVAEARAPAVVGASGPAANDAKEPLLCLATAHPAKFPEAIKQATGKDLARHPKIDALMDLPTRCQILANDAKAVRQFIVETAGGKPRKRK